MSAPTLLDPLDDAAPWPSGSAMDRAYVETFARRGSQALIANLRTQVMAIASNARLFPVTANGGEFGDAYVCLPHSAYALYAKAELKLVDVGPMRPALALAADAAGLAMRFGRLNRVVHLDNWMLSTNLHGGWTGDDLPAIRATLVERFPDHVLGIRSLTPWGDGRLVGAALADGWLLLPARQIYVTDDLTRDWRPRRNAQRDLELLDQVGPRRVKLDRLEPGDAVRISELYGFLYLDRYCRLNPDFTPAFVELTHRLGLIGYEGVRGADGRLSTVVGYCRRNGVLTTPIVGYDTSRPQAEGLYRMASVLLALAAEREGLRLNGSAGAPSFKRHRGARPMIEYTAYYAAHLPLRTRLVLAGMQQGLERLARPLLEEHRL
jgi:hypothetical protein